MNRGVKVLRNESGIYQRGVPVVTGLCSAAVTHAFEGKSVDSVLVQGAGLSLLLGGLVPQRSLGGQRLQGAGWLTPGSPGAASEPENRVESALWNPGSAEVFSHTEPAWSCAACEQVLLLLRLTLAGKAATASRVLMPQPGREFQDSRPASHFPFIRLFIHSGSTLPRPTV